MGESQRYRLVAPAAVGRIDRWLAETLSLSRSRLQALIREGRVRVDGVGVRPSFKLAGGECVDVELPPAPPSELVPQDLPVPILYTDEHIVVVDKPPGLVVHPARGHPDGTLVNALLHLISDDDGWAPARPGIVHRLDKGTSGVLVVARTPLAHARLAVQFAEHSVDRRYLALAWGAEPAAQGTVDAALGRHPHDRLRFAVLPGGKHAVTHWRRLGEARYPVAGDALGGALTLFECRLETGRTHQVRVHLSYVGHPLVGDPLYGRRGRLPRCLEPVLCDITHPLLHAGRLDFTHPVTGARLHFETPPPADFQRVLDALGLSSA